MLDHGPFKETTMLIRTERFEIELGLFMIYVRLGRWDWYWEPSR